MLVTVRWGSSEWVRGRSEKASDGDALFVDRGVPLVLVEGYGGEDGVAG